MTRTHHKIILILIVSFAFFNVKKTALAATVIDIGTLGGQEDCSQANLISANGSVIVGNSRFMDPNPDAAASGCWPYHAFKYTTSGGMVDLGSLDKKTGGTSYPSAMSADGSTIVGYSNAPKSIGMHAFKYNDSRGMVDLGTLGGTSSYPKAVSKDGLVIIGYSNINTELDKNHDHAFKYTDSEGMVDLGTLGGADSQAQAISADGSTIVGWSSTKSGNTHAFKYTKLGGMVDLGTLLEGSGSEASSISADGLVIIGSSRTKSGKYHTFKYTDSGGMVDLGISITKMSNDSFAPPVSADGSTIIGHSCSDNDVRVCRAFKYTTLGGLVNFGSLGKHNFPQAVSANGSVIVGWYVKSNDSSHAFEYNDSGMMFDLGTLGGADSQAQAISADGSTISGWSTTKSGKIHAFIYKTDGK